MKEISLGQSNLTAKVDDEDFAHLSSFKWHAMKSKDTYYAVRRPTINGKRTIIFMHKLLLNSKVVDHIDGDGLNNTRSNLRAASVAENRRNSKRNRVNSSGYKGVSYYSKGYVARIYVNNKNLYLGFFKSAESAALAYNEAAKTFFKEFARLNEVKNETA